ncbi:glycosyltransferase [Anaeromyxobacter sp. Red801]|uniref:glycosyltransferase n=1 Tax=Anaeromyxobacter sp. Red801 TaxID=3411632 RepID=UPI003BA28D99
MDSDGLLSVVIPVYRSEAYLAETVRAFVAFLEPRTRFEVVLVNDGSPDRVDDVIRDLCAADPRIRAITLGHNIGQHRATLRGFALTRGEVVVTVDDDGQNPPQSAWAVATALVDQDLDVVYGRFQSVEQSLPRRLASRLNRWLSRRTIHNDRDVAITNVRALRGDLARALGAVQSPYPYIDALVFRMTRHVGEVPVEQRARERGQSTYSLSRLFALWISHLTSLTVLPLQFAMVGSFSVSALGFLIGIAQLVRVLVEQRAPAGWLSLFVSVTFLFSVLFAFLGIISAYLGRMYVSLNERDLVWTRTVHPSRGAAELRQGARRDAAGSGG